MVVPRYDEGGFAALPATVARLLGVGEGGVALEGLPVPARRVVLVLLDAFGWPFFTRHGDHPLLRRLDVVARLTTQFPATTTAHITTLHSGLGVGEHGLYEWNVYDPALDALVTPLLFSFAGDGARDTLLRAGVDPTVVLPSPTTFHERLGAAGVASHVFEPAAFAPSTYDGVLARGAHIHPMADLPSGLVELAATLRAAEAPAYAYVYWDELDTTGHLRGPSSREFAAVAERCLDALDVGLRALPEGTVVLLAADHGQVDVDPATTVYVNEAWPQLPGLLAHGAGGRVLAPAGSARDLFLHCRPGTVDEVAGGLARLLGERATVHRVADLVAAGWFGPVGERLRARLPDLCVLPAPGETVWWRERHRFDMRFLGHHGGLSDDEARTQVAALVV
ncbi:MAG TPA: alkaline phosphatase family protein [Solirubrobacteraceae bacterium]